MKTSVIEAHNMLSVLSVEEVERRIGEVPGVESATVNFAAGSATVRYDETRLEIADIKSAVRQRGYESAEASAPTGDAPVSHPAMHAPSAVVSAVSAAPPNSAKQDHTVTSSTSTPVGGAPDAVTPAARTDATAPADASSADTNDIVPPLPPAADKKQAHSAHGAQPAMSADMAKEMGHGANMDLPAMVRDMRNRFWICLVFAVPIFIYSPMGNMFPAPTPPFGLPLNQWLFGLASAAVLYPSWPFFVAAWRALLNGKLNIDRKSVV